MSKNFLILHNIRSVYNVGAIFRTAECAGIYKIYLTGHTPTPIDRFGRTRNDFHKSALGTEKMMKWEHGKNILALTKKLKTEGIQIIAIEQNKNAIDYKNIKITKPTAFILGNEVKGIPESILKQADKIAEISLCGRKESLNVSIVAGIFLFRVLNI